MSARKPGGNRGVGRAPGGRGRGVAMIRRVPDRTPGEPAGGTTHDGAQVSSLTDLYPQRAKDRDETVPGRGRGAWATRSKSPAAGLSKNHDDEPFLSPNRVALVPHDQAQDSDLDGTEAESGSVIKDVLVVHDIPKGVDKEYLEMCFASPKHSGGNGAAEVLEVTEGAACLQFKSDEVAANVLKFSESKGIRLGQQKVNVEYARRQPKPSYEVNKLKLCAIPNGVDKDYLELFLDSVDLGVGFEVGEITDGSVIIKFEQDLSTSELEDVISAIRSKEIKDINYYLEVEKCRVITEIRVKNIMKHNDRQYIEMYFANHKKSGGGECTCELAGEREAVIKFRDPTVLETVMKRMESHINAFGNTVELLPVVPANKSSSSFLLQTTTESLSELKITVEPLIACLLKKHKDEVLDELKGTCVELHIDQDNCFVVVKSTALAKSDWHGVCKQHFTTSYSQTSVKLTPEISEDVMSLLGTLQQDAVFLYQISQDGTEITAAGHSSVIQSFQNGYDIIFASKSHLEESMHLEIHEFEFLRQCMQLVMRKDHPEVKIIFFEEEESRICLQGPACKVKKLRDSISSLSKHSSVIVAMSPASLKFFSSPCGSARLQKHIAEIKCPVAFTLKPSSQSSEMKLVLLCDTQFEGWAGSVAASLSNAVIFKSVCVPKPLVSKLLSSQEYTMLITECNSLISTFDDNVEIIGFQQDVTDAVKTIETFFQKERSLLVPVQLKINEVLAKAFHNNSSELQQRLQGMHVKIDIDMQQGYINVCPTQSTESGWQDKCRMQIAPYLEQFSHSPTLSLPKSASASIIACVSKFDHAHVVFAYSFQEQNTKVSLTLAGDTNLLSQIETEMNTIRAAHEASSLLIPLAPEMFLFVSELKRKEIEMKFPEVKVTYASRTTTVEITGSLHDIDCFKSYLDNQKPEVLPLATDKLVFQFLNTSIGKNELYSFTKRNCKAPLAIHFEQASVLFLSEQKDFQQAKEVVENLCQKLMVRRIQLPVSFSKLSPEIIQMFEDNFSKLEKECMVIITREKNSFIYVAGFEKHVEHSIGQIQAMVKKECTVTKTIPIEQGMWRLFQNHMNYKWKALISVCEQKEIQVDDSDGVKINLKGEETCVDSMTLDISQLIKSVARDSFAVHSPGTCRYFRNRQTRSLLIGYEHEMKVSINITEVEAESEQIALTLPSVPEVCICTTQVQTITGGLKEIKICTGDITEYKGDVIVNAANERLKHVGGVAKAISDKGGPEIQQASDEHISKSLHPLEPGDVWMSKQVGKLPCKAIIHAVGPRWNGGLNNEQFYLKKTCNASLRRASMYTYRSIALPAISCGIFGFPLEKCALVLTQATIEFLHSEQSSITEVTFVLVDRKNALAFVEALQKNPTIINTMTSLSAEPPKPSSKSSPNKQMPGTSIPIKLHRGDLLSVKADVYVNTTNENLDLSQGAVAVALAKAAGPTLQSECNSKAPINIGDIAVTGPGNLPCTHVFHVVAQKYDQKKSSNSEKMLKSLVTKCLKEWYKRSLKSIAFPSIGTGNLGFPSEVVAKVMMETVTNFLHKRKVLTGVSVHFVIFMHDTHQAFKSILSSSQTVASRKQPPSHSKTLSQKQKALPPSMFTVGEIKVHIIQGDITNDDSDAVVNTTNKNIKLEGRGVAAALLKKGGQELQKKCDIVVAQEGQLQEGEVICTEATGTLQCKSLFHVVFASDDPKLTIRACLLKAETKNYTSIAFPALGTGAHGYPADEAAKQMLEAIEQFVPQNLSEIHIVLFDYNVYQAFLQRFSFPEDESEDSTEEEVDVVVQPTIPERIYNYIASTASTASSMILGSSESPKTEEVQQPLFVTSNEATLVVKIFGENQTLVTDAKNKVHKLIEENSIVDRVTNPAVQKLSEDNIKEIMDKCRELEVVLEIERGVNSIKLKGERSDVTSVMMMIQQLLHVAEVQSAKKDRIKSLSDTVQWKSIKANSSVMNYDPDINYEIEAAYKQFCTDDRINSYTYRKHPFHFTIDFSAMKETDHIMKEQRRVISYVKMLKKLPKILKASLLLTGTECLLIKPHNAKY